MEVNRQCFCNYVLVLRFWSCTREAPSAWCETRRGPSRPSRTPWRTGSAPPSPCTTRSTPSPDSWTSEQGRINATALYLTDSCSACILINLRLRGHYYRKCNSSRTGDTRRGGRGGGRRCRGRTRGQREAPQILAPAPRAPARSRPQEVRGCFASANPLFITSALPLRPPAG